MKNEFLTVNGIMDGISVLEKDSKKELPNYKSDVLFNDKDPIDLGLQGLYHDERVIVSNYDFGEFEGVNLLSVTTEKNKVGTNFFA